MFCVKMELENIIGDLLLHHNCLIVPEFGGFVARPTSASIDYQNGVFSPPSKDVLFNKHLTANDGLLISKYAISNNTTYEDALHRVKQHVVVWNNMLSRGERISIDRVGVLFIDAQKNICFKQDKQFNLLLSSYGLSSVKFQPFYNVVNNDNVFNVQPLLTHSPSKNNSVVVNNKGIQRNFISFETPQHSQTDFSRSTKDTSVWKHIMAACIVPVIFYTFWIPLKTEVLESKILSFNDLNPFHKHSLSEYEPKEMSTLFPSINNSNLKLSESIQLIETTEHTYSYKLRDDTYIIVNIESDFTTEHLDEQSAKHSDQNTSKTINTLKKHTKTFHYIVGCFSQESNAQKLVDIMRSCGIDAFIYDKKGGLYRVSAGQSSSLSEAEGLARLVKSIGYSGWILK